ncbi:MAG: P1 family peptidase, partial [Candidatus Binataceae bacterium]
FHVKPSHAIAALDGARNGRVVEGCVGGGTGMIGYGWKGGIGTASRRLAPVAGGYTLGVLVQLNCGRRSELVIAGVPVARALASEPKYSASRELGSIIIVAATDAPLLPHQLKRIARRLTMGLARTGSVSGNGSGDLFLAFSSANPPERSRTEKRAHVIDVPMLRNSQIDPLFTAAVQATEEAIVNALIAADSMSGIDGHVIAALPHDRIRKIFLSRGTD